MTKFLFKISLAIVASLALTSCVMAPRTRIHSADGLAKKHHFVKKYVTGGDFKIVTYQRITDIMAPYVMYIEGDGYAFKRFSVSDDPTPINRMFLSLASIDKRRNIVYIARPCQYSLDLINPKCSDHAYWSDKRFSEEVIVAMNEVVKTIADDKPVHLVGYSGGGAVAVLVAARNKSVASILTVAGNLDIVEFVKFHYDRPMIGSLNPRDYAQAVQSIPQLHVSSADDVIVPPFIMNGFISQMLSTHCVQQQIVNGPSHVNGWYKIWPWVLDIPILCNKR